MGIVHSEIKHLKTLSLGGKLPPKDSSDLIGYVKLLGEMKKQQQDFYRLKKEAEANDLESLSDEEFERLIKNFLTKPKDKK